MSKFLTLWRIACVTSNRSLAKLNWLAILIYSLGFAISILTIYAFCSFFGVTAKDMFYLFAGVCALIFVVTDGPSYFSCRLER